MVKINKILSDDSRDIKVKNAFDYIELSRKGLTINQLYKILDYINMDIKELSKVISLSEKQLNKYGKDKNIKNRYIRPIDPNRGIVCKRLRVI